MNRRQFLKGLTTFVAGTALSPQFLDWVEGNPVQLASWLPVTFTYYLDPAGKAYLKHGFDRGRDQLQIWNLTSSQVVIRQRISGRWMPKRTFLLQQPDGTYIRPTAGNSHFMGEFRPVEP